MSRHLARWAGFSAGYFLLVLLERAVVRLEAPAPDELEDQDDEDAGLELLDLTEILRDHPCAACCGGAA